MESPRDPVAVAATRRRSAVRLTGVALAAGLVGGGLVAAVDHTNASPSSATPSAAAAPRPQTNDIAARPGAGKSVEQIARTDGQGVVSVLATSPATGRGADGQPHSGQQVSEGTGFMLDRAGHLLTNDHVVEGATSVRVILQNTRSVPAKVVGTDRSTDLAVLKVDLPAGQLHPLALGSSATVRVGSPVVAIGSPFGLDHTVTAGIVSAVQRQITAPNGFAINNAIQTDAAINHGNSGGPLIDAQGRVIGINAQLPEGSDVDGNVGIGFAIPIDTAKPVIRQIVASGKVSHSWLGISGSAIDASVPSTLRLPATHGILISGVVPGGPADKAHLASGSTSVVVNGQPYCTGGDVITAADGRRISSFDQLSAAIGRKAPGDHLSLTVVHAGGTTSTVDVTLGAQPAQPPATHTSCGNS
jgi:S1-C subfamily serine protease